MKPMKFSSIILDMDGLISNFHLEAVRAHLRAGKKFPHIHNGEPLQLGVEVLHAKWPRGLSLQKYMGNGKSQMTLDEFWKPIRTDPMFWSKIPPYPNYKELVDLLRDYCYDLVLCTHADWTPASHGGKREWLAANGLADLEYITMQKKWRLADPTCLLIDDFEDHIKAWRREIKKRYGIEGVVIPPDDRIEPVPIGCHAILYPQPWNSNHPHTYEQLEYVERCIKFYLEPKNVHSRTNE